MRYLSLPSCAATSANLESPVSYYLHHFLHLGRQVSGPEARLRERQTPRTWICFFFPSPPNEQSKHKKSQRQ